MDFLNSATLDALRTLPGSTRVAPMQRCSSLYAQSQAADAVYLIEEGLIKLTRTNETGGKIILAIHGQNQLVGEESLSDDSSVYYTEAVAITNITVHRIPERAIADALCSNSELSSSLIKYLISRKLDLAEKVELLCLQDVEHRILHYLAKLASLLPSGADSNGHQIPITQLELADLIGATRETTSTTLNQLERRGLLKLSRRLLTIHSPDILRNAANSRKDPALQVATGVPS